MIKYNNTNNASTTLTAWISPSSTTLIVENGDILPTAPFLLTLEHFDNEKVTVREIVKCIAKVWNILTIQRGAWTCVQDDSATPKTQNNTPHSFSVWDVASIYWTSEQVQDIQNEIEKKLNIDDFQAWTYVYGATSTWTDTYSITIPWTITSYSVGQVFRFMADVENTWNATLNVNWIWAIEILKNHDQHLQSGDIEAWQIVEVAFDGTNFQMNSQIAQVVSLDDISSLSYNDLTCYAGEEIKENDLIITNGNSFNPDRTDESTDVWGQTVNKYAIWFVGNGESADTFLIKTSVNSWTEPDTVTVNIETDDNWKPSGTVIETTNIASWVVASWVSINDDFPYHFNTPWKWFFRIYPLSSWHRYLETSNWYKYYFYDADWNAVTDTLSFLTTSFDDKTIAFSKTVTSPSSSVLVVFEFTWNSYVKKWERALTDNSSRSISSMTSDWKTVLLRPYSSDNQKILVSNTPFDFSEYTTYTPTTTIKKSSYNNEQYFIAKSLSWNLYLFTLVGTNGAKATRRVFSVWEDYEVTSLGSFSQRSNWTNSIWYDNWSVTIFAWSDQTADTCNEIKFVWDVYYWPKVTWITFWNTITTTKWTKYRLTIAPVKTWSVINCLVMFDKEGEYYSEVAVKDMNNWSNVSDKTPYIDANCILARYALKSNLIDWINKIPRWFANGDYTSVSYCFKWKKSNFQWLEQDTIYYSDNDWKITTNLWPCKVWQTTNDTDLIVNIDFWGKSFSKVYHWKFTDSFKVPYDWYIKYSFSIQNTAYSFVVWWTNVIDTKTWNQWSTATTVSLAYTFVPAWTTISLSTTENSWTLAVSWTVEFLSAREN